ncbi:uncharacterized protein [Amphiura filiformis]|uniref:uncharacterized protein n=1 Tax=Amphiura filiformis TaxID=82378 RepID=UPI003B226970
MPISSTRDRLTLQLDTPAASNVTASDRPNQQKSPSTNSTEVGNIKQRKVTLPSIEKLKIDDKTTVCGNVVGRSLSHGSATAHQSAKHHHIVKPKSIHHHPGHQQHHRHHHKKRKSKKEKEGDDIVLRKIRFFSSQPEPAPYTLCLSFPGVDLSHRQLLDAITSTDIIHKEDVKSIQFVDMNCILGTAGVDNRWYVTVKDFDTRYLLLRNCIWIDNDPLHFRLLDDVNMEDYKEYRRRVVTLQSDEHVSALERLLALHY